MSASPTPTHGPRDCVISNPATIAVSASPRPVTGKPSTSLLLPQPGANLRSHMQ